MKNARVWLLAALLIAGNSSRVLADDGGWGAAFNDAQDHYGTVGSANNVLSQTADWAALAQSFYESLQGVEMQVDALMVDVPQMESCCVSVDECSEQLQEVDDFIKQIFNQLEQNYRVYYVTMEKFRLRKIMMASAGAAASALESSNDPDSINAGQAKLFHTYDTTQEDLMQKLHNGLDKVEQLEKEYCHQTNWLQTHGFTLEVALRARYARPGASLTTVPPSADLSPGL